MPVESDGAVVAVLRRDDPPQASIVAAIIKASSISDLTIPPPHPD
jgi:hypothetical protein